MYQLIFGYDIFKWFSTINVNNSLGRIKFRFVCTKCVLLLIETKTKKKKLGISWIYENGTIRWLRNEIFPKKVSASHQHIQTLFFCFICAYVLSGCSFAAFSCFFLFFTVCVYVPFWVSWNYVIGNCYFHRFVVYFGLFKAFILYFLSAFVAIMSGYYKKDLHFEGGGGRKDAIRPGNDETEIHK